MLIWQTWHRWLALLAGLQLTIWLVTGLLFNLIDDTWLDSNHYHQKASQTQSPKQHLSTTDSINTLLNRLSAHTIKQIKLTTLLDKPMFAVNTTQGSLYFWADNLAPVELTSDDIRNIAQSSYSGQGNLGEAKPATHLTRFGHAKQIYQFDTNDELATQIFVDGDSGTVLGHLNQRSAIRDLLFMLHFMDYNPDNGLEFNHFITQLFALLSLFLGITGALTLLKKAKDGAFTLNWFWRKNNHKLIVLTPEHQALAELTVYGKTLLDSLNHPCTRLRTSCGGGGRCGLCRVQFIENAPFANEYDINKLNASEIAQGIRLSCQHNTEQGQIALCTHAQLKQWHNAETRNKHQKTAKPLAKE